MASDSRRELLVRVVDQLSSVGLQDLSLRGLAAQVGTSHRMLIYHFGSQDGLMHAVVAEVEERQRSYLLGIALADDLSLADMAMALWKRVSAPELQQLERLFFGLYSRLLQQGEQDLAAQLVRSWLDPVVPLMVARGLTPAQASTLARLGLAVFRGLLLDLLATGDRRAVDAAMRTYVAAVLNPR